MKTKTSKIMEIPTSIAKEIPKYHKRSFWDYLAWIILFTIVLWLILKVIGIINTPILLEYYPLFGAAYMAGWIVHKLERTIEEVKEIKTDLKCFEKDFAVLKYNCPKLIS